MFNAARVQEIIIENLPEPPDMDVDEIKVKLKRLKKFNQKLLDDRNEAHGRGYQGGMFGFYIIPRLFDRAQLPMRGGWVSAQMNWLRSPWDKV